MQGKPPDTKGKGKGKGKPMTPGQQLDAARAEVQDKEDQLASATKALEEAEQRVQSAQQTLVKARQDLATLEEILSSSAASTRPTWLEEVRTLLAALREAGATVALPLPAQRAASSLLERIVATEPADEAQAEPVSTQDRLAEPLDEEVRRCFGGRKAWRTAAETDDEDEPPTPPAKAARCSEVKLMDVENADCLTPRGAAEPAKGNGKGSDWGAMSVEELERRLNLCQQQQIAALERKQFTEANAVSGVMSELIAMLEARSG